jgi:hypothetical protein
MQLLVFCSIVAEIFVSLNIYKYLHYILLELTNNELVEMDQYACAPKVVTNMFLGHRNEIMNIFMRKFLWGN